MQKCLYLGIRAESEVKLNKQEDCTGHVAGKQTLVLQKRSLNVYLQSTSKFATLCPVIPWRSFGDVQRSLNSYDFCLVGSGPMLWRKLFALLKEDRGFLLFLNFNLNSWKEKWLKEYVKLGLIKHGGEADRTWFWQVAKEIALMAKIQLDSAPAYGKATSVRETS